MRVSLWCACVKLTRVRVRVTINTTRVCVRTLNSLMRSEKAMSSVVCVYTSMWHVSRS